MCEGMICIEHPVGTNARSKIFLLKIRLVAPLAPAFLFFKDDSPGLAAILLCCLIKCQDIIALGHDQSNRFILNTSRVQSPILFHHLSNVHRPQHTETWSQSPGSLAPVSYFVQLDLLNCLPQHVCSRHILPTQQICARVLCHD